MIDITNTDVWRPIPGFDEKFYVSTEGDIFSVRNNKILTRKVNYRGYGINWLTLNGKVRFIRVHRAVAMAFIPNPLNKPEVNHENGIKTDNRLENLVWATRKENIEHAKKEGLYRGNGGKKKKIKRTNIATQEVVIFKSLSDAICATFDAPKNEIPASKFRSRAYMLNNVIFGVVPQYKGHVYEYAEDENSVND